MPMLTNVYMVFLQRFSTLVENMVTSLTFVLPSWHLLRIAHLNDNGTATATRTTG